MTKPDFLLQSPQYKPKILQHFGAILATLLNNNTNQLPQNAKVVPFCRLKNVAAIAL
jgi:hypothetical protein